MKLSKRVERLIKKIKDKKEFTAEKWVEFQKEFNLRKFDELIMGGWYKSYVVEDWFLEDGDNLLGVLIVKLENDIREVRSFIFKNENGSWVSIH